MANITPCLWYDNQAEEAANHYTSIFPDAKIVDVQRYGEGGPLPAGTVLTVQFELRGQRFMALNGGPGHPFSDAVSFQIDCADQAEVDYYWQRLSEGGQEGPCGWLTDRFGLSWQVVPRVLPQLLSDPDPDKAARAMQAMMSMKKIDIQAVQDAHAGG